MHIYAVVSAVVFVSLSLLFTLASKAHAVADSACIEQPDRDAPQGEHWYYHFDREKNRKCWHLGPVIAVVHESPPLVRAERPHTVASTVNSVFGPLVRGLKRLFHQPMPHEAVAGEPRIVQSDATKPLTIEDIAQPAEFPEERAEARPLTSLTAAQRRALFEEYLKWEELQRNAGTSGGGAAPAQAR